MKIEILENGDLALELYKPERDALNKLSRLIGIVEYELKLDRPEAIDWACSQAGKPLPLVAEDTAE